MLLRIELEPINSWIQGGTVAHWHVAVGGLVAFGDPLCDIAVHEILQQKREQSRVRMTAEEFPRTYTEARKVDVRVRLTSADSGTVVAIDKAEGSAVRVGELLAVAANGASAAVEHEEAVTDDAPRFRVVAEVIEGDEWLP